MEVVRSRFLDGAIAGVVVEFLRGIGLEAVVVEDVEEPMLVKNLARAYVEGA